MNLEDFEVIKVPNEECFFSLLQECGTDGFYHNRTTLLKGYIRGNVYTVSGRGEADSMWSRYYDFTASYQKGWDRMHILPCFCMVDGNACDMLWVHERIQKNGVARMMLDALKVKRVNNPLPQSKRFWDKYFNKLQL